MSLNLAAGATVSYTLAAGLTLSIVGEGLAQLPPAGAERANRRPHTITPGGVLLGPYSSAQVITIRAESGGPGIAYTPSSTWEPQDSNRTLTAADDGKCIAATAAITITVPSGLSPQPAVALLPPPSGNLSVTGTLNGSSQTLTRTRANNPAGVSLTPYPDVDGYGLSGT